MIDIKNGILSKLNILNNWLMP